MHASPPAAVPLPARPVATPPVIQPRVQPQPRPKIPTAPSSNFNPWRGRTNPGTAAVKGIIGGAMVGALTGVVFSPLTIVILRRGFGIEMGILDTFILGEVIFSVGGVVLTVINEALH